MADSLAQDKSLWKSALVFLEKAKPILPIMEGCTTVYGFVQLLQGNQALIMWIAAVGALLLSIVTALYLGWFNREATPRLRKLARGLTVALLLSGLALSWGIYQRNLERNAKFVILVLGFKGPNPENYQVSDTIHTQLEEALQPYVGESEVRSLDIEVGEAEGREKAVKLGKDYRADLVLWGRYQIGGSVVRVTVHVENLAALSHRTIERSDNYVDESPAQDLQFEDKLSKQSKTLALFISGMTRYEVKDYFEAEKRISQAIELGEWPEQLNSKAMLYFYRGYARLQLKEYEKCIQDFDEVVSLIIATNPPEKERRLAKSYNNRGQCYRYSGKPDEAIADFEQAIRADSEFLNSYLNLGSLFLDAGDYDRAKSQLMVVLQKDSQNAAAHNNLGYLYQKQKEYSQSIKELDLALKSDPDNYIAYHNRGFSHEKLGELNAAIEDYSAALARNPDYIKSYYNRGSLYLTQKKYYLAIVDLRNVIERDPNFVSAHVNLGRAYRKSSDYENALKHLSEAIKLDPHRATAFYYRGLVYRDINKNELAIKDFQAALDNTNDEKLIQAVNLELSKISAKP